MSSERRRPREYPWIFERRALSGGSRHSCEICGGSAAYVVKFEEKETIDLLSLFLCLDHGFRARTPEGLKRIIEELDKKLGRNEP